ncbi:MAG: hypothetical protein HY701_11740 [Gemmatimonadetes bacterium]|nr:hypothetical protein [Gemmatimonadota bacterium]
MVKRDVAAALALAGVTCLVGACGTAPPARQPVEQAIAQTKRVALHVDKMT